MTLLSWAIVVAVVGTVADWYTTRAFMKRGFREANPVGRAVIQWVKRRGGGINAQAFASALAVDGVIIGGFSVFLWRGIAGLGAAIFFLFLAGGIQILAAIWNVRLMRRYR